MTIKELEEAVGMTRANIRFYEQEGLISPTRGENGYRDYTRADGETLEKIKLLRQLQLGLDTIRALQKGEVPPMPGHPWRRYFARRLDLGLYSLPFILLLLLRFRLGHPLSMQTMEHWLFRLVFSYLSVGVMLLVEPLLLHYWGTTPGKWVFGIRLRDADGEKFTLSQALERTWRMFGRGMGYNIPFYRLWRMAQSHKQVKDGERNEWAWFDSLRTERMEIPDSLGRCFAYLGASLLPVALAVVMTLQAVLPPHRGEPDLAAFCENYNYYNTIRNDSTRYFDGEGELQLGNPTVYDLLYHIQPRGWSPVTENGKTVGFQYKAVYAGTWFSPFNNLYQQFGTLAFAGTLPQMNALNFRSRRWTDVLPQDRWNYDFTYRGVRFIQEAHLEGQAPGTVPREDDFSTKGKATLYLTFTLRLA